VAHWAPNQLRHSMGTRVRKHFGRDAAQQALGHASPLVTDVYAELPIDQAERAIRRLG
jgi:integrase